jgi:hypothetical protein
MHSDLTPVVGRSKRQKLPAWHYWTYWAGLLCALVAALSALGVISWHSKRESLALRSSELATGAQSGGASSSASVDLPQRPLYPYSVIPGGVESAQELRNAVAHDPLVAEHYANFDLSRAHVVRLTHGREVYVSYRLGDRIYWTKRRLLLRAGETVITDGKHEARTRCGNRISETPVKPVSKNEPASAAMDAPPTFGLFADNTGAPPNLPLYPSSVDPINPALPSLPLPPSSPPITVIPPPFFPIVGGGPPSFPGVIPPPQPTPTPTTPTATPEPGALSLLLLGLLILTAKAGISNLRKFFKT